MKLLRCLLMSILLLTSSLFSKDIIRITNGEWPPYLSKNLPHYGLASHLVKEIFAAVDVEVEYGFFPWKRSYKYAKEGKGLKNNDIWNGTVVWLYTDKRAKDFLYSDPVIFDTGVLYYLKSNPIKWEKVSDLKGKTIGGTAHTSYPLFEKAQKENILMIDRAGNYDILYKRLLAKRIDAVPQVKNVGNFFLRTSLNSKQRDQITFYPTVFDERKYHLILNKKNKENVKFIKLFNKGLKIIKENGKYDELFQNLHLGKYDTKYE